MKFIIDPLLLYGTLFSTVNTAMFLSDTLDKLNIRRERRQSSFSMMAKVLDLGLVLEYTQRWRCCILARRIMSRRVMFTWLATL